MSETKLLFAARLYRDSGLSVIPIKADGSKCPDLRTWTEYQRRRPNDEELNQWFGNGVVRGIGIPCGEVSGNLELLDFDSSDAYPEFERITGNEGLLALVQTLPLEETPGGGNHLVYRVDGRVPGNLKLARERRLAAEGDKDAKQDPATGQWYTVKTIIETRGEGGQFVCFPTPAKCHEHNKPYVMIRGNLRNIPVITMEQRDALHVIARMFHDPEIDRPSDSQSRSSTHHEGEPLRPGDDYNQRGPVLEVLQKHGWAVSGQIREATTLRRPGKERGHSATFDFGGSRLLYVFSSNADPFEPDRAYSPFRVYALLEHDGDFKAAAKALVDEGYGEKAGTVKVSLGPGSSGGLVDSPADHLSEDKYPAFPYTVDKGRIVFLSVSGAGESRKAEPKPVCEFQALITTEVTAEDGRKSWTIEGKTTRRRPFEVEIDAKAFTDPKMLKGALAAGSGPVSPVNAGMDKHLGPAIQRLTDAYGTVKSITHYDRTGWQDATCSRFLIAGHRDDESIRLTRRKDLPFQVSSEINVEAGLKALRALMTCKPPDFCLILLAHVLTGPAARIAGWGSDRFGSFVDGPTGSFKTTFTTIILSIFGPLFADAVHIAKWGEGSTSNAILAMATYCGDLPFLIDNYKPGTGGGQKAFIGLVHNILEGAERARLNRNSQLQTSREINAWLICTGEDTPNGDAATLARLIILHASRDETDLSLLADAQEQSHNLCAIGAAWLQWLETPEGRAAATLVGARFRETRADWRRIVMDEKPDLSPHGRTMGNIAINHLMGDLIAMCPFLSPLWNEVNRHGDHLFGLKEIAIDMTSGTSEASEGNRFLSVLASLINSGRAELVIKGQALSTARDPDRVIGWKAPDDSIYLDEELAIANIEKLRGKDFLGGVSKATVRKQLDAMGALGERDKDHLTKRIYCAGGGRPEVIHIKADFLSRSGETEEEEAEK